MNDRLQNLACVYEATERKNAADDPHGMPSPRTRIAALAVAVILFLAFALSPVAIAHELHHDCPGANCAVCAELAGNLSLARGGSVPACPATPLAIMLITVIASLGAVRFSYAPVTLVSLKVRLDD